ncbi:MAG: hypothetical protein AAF741_12815 [Bacteroidota bacterium]
MPGKFLIIVAFLIIFSCKKPENDTHAVDVPLRPIELRVDREVEEAPRPSNRIRIASNRELTDYLAPRLVAIMTQVETAEAIYKRPSQIDWLRQLKVDYRRIFNQLNLLGNKNDYTVSAELTPAMQQQVQALIRLSGNDIRRQYPDLLRDQLEEMSRNLAVVGKGVTSNYLALQKDMVQLINSHLEGLTQLF